MFFNSYNSYDETNIYQLKNKHIFYIANIAIVLSIFNICSLFTSIALLNISSILLSLLAAYLWLRILFDKHYMHEKLLCIQNKHIILLLCSLPIYIFIHECYFSQSITFAFHAVNAWRPLIYGLLWLAIFICYPKIYVYLACCFIACITVFSIIGVGYYLFTGKAFDPIVYKHAPYLATQVLITGIVLVWQLSIQTKNKKLKYALFFIGACGSLMVFLASARRTAYIIYGIVIFVFICRYFKQFMYAQNSTSLNYLGKPQSKFKKISIIFRFLTACSIVCTALYFTPVTHKRIQEAIHEVQEYKQQKQFIAASETSNGLRLRFWHVSTDIIRSNLWLGVGFSKYVPSFRATEKKIDGYNIVFKVFHPHNEFLYVWSCFGIFAFLIYIGILIYPIFNYARLNKRIKILDNLNKVQLTTMHFTFILAYIACIVGTLFNAMAIDMIEGHFLAWILAAYYAFYLHIHHKKLKNHTR
jgi:O-antigen ligase